jgi:hypothetical protein
MSFPIIINSTNYSTPNTYKVNLANTVDLNKYDVSVGSAYIYYSWYNINSNPLNNNKFTLTIPRNGGSDTLNVTIPDGAYQIADLNNYLQYLLIQNGYYIYDSTSRVNTFYAAFVVSPTSYAVQFITTPLPTSLPAGFTSGGMTFPASANQHYQLTVLANNQFDDIIGFNPGTYPTVPTNTGTQTKNSDYTPNVNPVSTVQMRLSCVYNPFSSNSQLIHVFNNKGVSIGSLIDASPIQLQYVPCNGSHKELTLSFYDQNGYVLNILDKNLVIKLIFKPKEQRD